MRISFPGLNFEGNQDLMSPTWILKCKLLGYRDLHGFTSPVMYVVVVAVAATDLICVAPGSFPDSLVRAAKVKGWFLDCARLQMGI